MAALAIALIVIASAAVITSAPNEYQRFGNSSLAGNYELVCELKAIDEIPVLKFRSLRTGLRIVLARVEGPLVHGYFTLATEAQDDDGLPHTLEHLVFLGSEKYPFKGALDLLANRCLASGTNAWTDTDHTAYTVQTAGHEGFLNLLPIYLDHLLYPTLTDSGFITEVYHITGDGKDAGVVYSEMQARENSASDLCFKAMFRAMYPEPSGYRYRTGGIMKNLRESTSIEKIRNYHRDFYRPENLNVIITGLVEPEQVFEAIESIEQKIVSKGERTPYERPWESQVPPLNGSMDQLIEYPSDSEKTGLVLVSWRGPSAVGNVNQIISVIILMEYLTHSSISPLPTAFVEVDDPLASGVSSNCYENSISVCYFGFGGVPRAKVDQVKPLLMATLEKLVTGQAKIAMKDMKDMIKKTISSQDSGLETSPHSIVAGSIIGDILYGYTCEHMDSRLSKKSTLIKLLEQPEKYWLKMIEEYLLKKPSVTIRGVPSKAEKKRIEAEEKQRIEARKQTLGEDQLKVWKDKLENAKQTNEIPPPDQVLQSLPVPGVDGIHYHSYEAYNNHLDFASSMKMSKSKFPFSQPLSTLPFRFQVDDLHSNFVEIIAILDTSTMQPSLRPYLSLLLDLFFESPIARGETIIPHEDVVRELSADTLSRYAIFGLRLSSASGPFSSNVAVILKVEMAKYERGVQWLREVLFNTHLTADRMKVKAKAIINSIDSLKESASSVMYLMFNDLIYKKDTNKNQQSFLKQEKFLTSLLERLKTEEDVVLKEINEARNNIVQRDHITIHMATNVEKLSTSIDPLVPWANFISKRGTPKKKMLNTIPEHQLLSHEDFGNVTGFLTGVGSVESAYLLQSTRLIMDDRDWDLPALYTAIQYLTQTEGPMWRGIRGKGLAYSYGMSFSPTAGLLRLQLAKASQLKGAYEEAINILNSYINGSSSWDVNLLDSARSSLMFGVIGSEDVVASLVQQSIMAYFRRIPHSYSRDLIDRIASVTLEDVIRVSQVYFVPLLNPNTSNTVIVCNPSKVHEVAESFKTYGHNLEVVESIEDSRFA